MRRTRKSGESPRHYGEAPSRSQLNPTRPPEPSRLPRPPSAASRKTAPLRPGSPWLDSLSRTGSQTAPNGAEVAEPVDAKVSKTFALAGVRVRVPPSALHGFERNPDSQPERQGSDVTVTYAGFWKRFAAVIIDGIILVVLFGFVTLKSVSREFNSSGASQEQVDGFARGLESEWSAFRETLWNAPRYGYPPDGVVRDLASTDICCVATTFDIDMAIPRCDCTVHGQEAGTARHDG